jgi:threonine dehydrogenase-like Zn-dependent dehydrogenase
MTFLSGVHFSNFTSAHCKLRPNTKGTVAAFGVPDDAVYAFEFSKFFRKNVTMIASVIPDPGKDFPEAVALIERGAFSTDGLLTHSIPFKKVQEGFEIASKYLDGAIKLVFEM